ncbi:stage II sporulation protein E [Staphylospora marina]|uniref:stage II sporulation protein E n=1 Tax=Staphylospora marina TaxID=2490858 RepID=UPI000F5B9617|nr:stage II sporulation protein E [Staphylospora marina]
MTLRLGTHLKRRLTMSFMNRFRLDRSRARRLWHRFVQLWHIPLLIMGFLLGRATILESVAPFAAAYFGVVYHLARKQWPAVMAALIAGAATLGPLEAARTGGTLLLVLAVQKIWSWAGKERIDYVPFVVAVGGIAARLMEMVWEGWDPYSGMLAAMEVMLSFILTFIFVRCLPLFTVRKKRFFLRHEEMVCLVILVGSVMTGTMGWEVGGFSVVHVVSRLAVLVLALVGGGLVSASMGVVTGLILSLSNPDSLVEISLLAFAGLLAGLFREGGRIGVSVGFMLGAAILTLYDGGTSAMWRSLQESALSVGLFLLIPRAVFKSMSRYVPGTPENQAEHQDYIRRLRDVTAARVERFTGLFQELALSFREEATRRTREDEEQVQRFLADVMSEACMGCRLFSRCWEERVIETYQGMTQLMTMVEAGERDGDFTPPSFWIRSCDRPEKTLGAIRKLYKEAEQEMFWREKMKESRRLVSDQLAGMAEVMGALAREIRHETQVLAAHEEQIHEAIERLGLSIGRVDVINLEEGKVEIEIVMPDREGLEECKKLVAPLLTEVLGEPVTVQRKEVRDGTPGAVITIGSAQRYELKTGVAGVAKGGGAISGDSYAFMNLGTGKYAVALSDGMGNGQRAREESTAALKLIRRLLLAGMGEGRAVETVNSILRLRSSDEMFATIDLALVDLNTAHARFMKIGSSPGFIKRGKQVLKLEASNPPIGILPRVDAEPIEMQLMPGDFIIMVTDGVYDGPGHQAIGDEELAALIAQTDTRDPQDFAERLLKQVVNTHEGRIFDDMTVIVTKVERHAPEWSTIRLPGVGRVERAKAAG